MKSPAQYKRAADNLAKGMSINAALTNAGWSPKSIKGGRAHLPQAIQQLLCSKGVDIWSIGQRVHKIYKNGRERRRAKQVRRTQRQVRPNNAPTTHVLISDQVFLHKEKAPFVPSGVSTLGAVEYDPEKDCMRCHECGNWYKSLANHISHFHGPVRSYKEKHGLKYSTALISEGQRIAAMRVSSNLKNGGKPPFTSASAKAASKVAALKHSRRKNGNAEYLNLQGRCQAQRKADLLEKVKNIAASNGGNAPARETLAKAGIRTQTLQYYFGSLAEVWKQAKLIPPPRNGHRPGDVRSKPSRYTPELLREMVLNFHKNHGRFPQQSDSKRGFVPAQPTIVRYLGKDWKDKIQLQMTKESVK